MNTNTTDGIGSRDRARLRALAGRLAEYAATPANSALRQEWTRHNGLRPGRPLILCFPEGAWTEIVTDNALECTNSTARAWERNLFMKLHTHEVLRDDQPVDATFPINWQVEVGDYGVPVEQHHTEGRGAYIYEPPLTNLPADFGRLRRRSLRVDRAATAQLVDSAAALFGDLLPVRIRGAFWWTLGLTWEAIKLIGLEPLMFAPYDQPDNLHRLMQWLRDETTGFIDWFEREGLLTDQNENDYVGSGGLGYSDELPRPDRAPGSPARLIDLWGFAESQETVGVSPEMFAEFILPYQMPLLERFGLNCYGCCEPVDARLDAILTIPRLRRVSVSPWANQAVVAERLGANYVYSRKPNPAPVCVGFSEDAIRADLAETARVARDCRVEVIMKDTHTVEFDGRRLARWVEMARRALG